MRSVYRNKNHKVGKASFVADCKTAEDRIKRPVSPFNKIIKRLTRSEITFITSSTFLKLKTWGDSHVPALFSLLTIIFAINSRLDVNRLAARACMSSLSHTLILTQCNISCATLCMSNSISKVHNSSLANCQRRSCISQEKWQRETKKQKKSCSAEMMCAPWNMALVCIHGAHAMQRRFDHQVSAALAINNNAPMHKPKSVVPLD